MKIFSITFGCIDGDIDDPRCWWLVLFLLLTVLLLLILCDIGCNDSDVDDITELTEDKSSLFLLNFLCILFWFNDGNNNDDDEREITDNPSLFWLNVLILMFLMLM